MRTAGTSVRGESSCAPRECLGRVTGKRKVVHCPTGHGHHQFCSRRSGGEGPEQLAVGGTVFEWLGGSAKMIAERQVHELGACGFECVCFDGIPWWPAS